MTPLAIETPSVDWLALSPVLTLLGASGFALLGAVFVPGVARRAVAAVSVALGFAAAAALAGIVYWRSADAEDVIAGTFARDRFAALAQILVCGAGLLTVLLSWHEDTGGAESAEGSGAGGASLRPGGSDTERGRDRWRDDHAGEYFALLAAAGAGMAFFVAADNLMVLFLALEWFSLCLYVLCAISGDRTDSLEAGLKYLIVGSFGSAILLFGCALVYGATGELRFEAIAEAGGGALEDDALLLAGLAMVIAGIAFKASAAPFHMWTPDVYEGAPTSVTAFMASATKVAAFAAGIRVLVEAFPEQSEFWRIAVAAIACASLAIGNLAALVQRNVKRMLAYSSVSHAGFMLIAVAANNELGGRALLFYLLPYAAMSLGAFAVVAARERELREPVTLDSLAGFGWERPLLGVAMWVFMLGFAGLPLTGGFLGKFYVFSAAYEAGWSWLIIVGVAATALSLYYYLAVIRALYMRFPGELRVAPAGGSPPREALVQIAVLVCLVVTVGSFVAADPIIDLAREGAEALRF